MNYTRHVSDYSISAHEIFTAMQEGKEPFVQSIPDHSYIAYVDNLTNETRPQVIQQIIDAAIAQSGEVLHRKRMAFDEGKDVSDYTVFMQDVVVFKDSVIEIYEKLKQICAIVISKNEAVTGAIKTLVEEIRGAYVPPKEERTFYMIGQNRNGYELQKLEINSQLDPEVIQTNYVDEFSEISQKMIKLIEDDKRGLVLFHGLPGTGKTTYIKYLVNGGYDRKVVYVPPHLANVLGNPDFVTFVREQLSDSVLIIEDGEEILRDREAQTSPAVSNLLNISDGIMGDALNILIVCTFNCNVEFIDKALLRPGRLKLKYEFGKLTYQKANALAKKLYGETVELPKQAYTVAEVYNHGETLDYSPKKEKPAMGFVSAK